MVCGKAGRVLGHFAASRTEAYAGKLRRAQELTRLAVNSAIRADNNESGAIWLENSGCARSGVWQFRGRDGRSHARLESCSGKSGSNGGSRAGICHGKRRRSC